MELWILFAQNSSSFTTTTITSRFTPDRAAVSFMATDALLHAVGAVKPRTHVSMWRPMLITLAMAGADVNGSSPDDDPAAEAGLRHSIPDFAHSPDVIVFLGNPEHWPGIRITAETAEDLQYALHSIRHLSPSSLSPSVVRSPSPSHDSGSSSTVTYHLVMDDLADHDV
jgi:hypothetical protein